MEPGDKLDLDRHIYEKYLQAGNLAKLLAPSELDIENGCTREARAFIEEFKRTKKISLLNAAVAE